MSAIFLAVAFLAMQAYKYVVIFMSDTESFFAYSVVFCSSNGMILLFMLFMNSGETQASIVTIVEDLMKGEERDKLRDTNFEEEITAERKDKSYHPTFHDVTDLYTVENVEPGQIGKCF